MLKPHLQYLKYLIRHKWFVFRAGLKVRAPLWRLIIHDWSKFTPSEWGPYVNHFYRKTNRSGSYSVAQEFQEFNYAWLHHQHKNPHHWQHWVLREDSGKMFGLPIPDTFIKEMVADWIGTGQSLGFGPLNAIDWYEKNRDIIILEETTRDKVEYLLWKYRVDSEMDMLV